MTIGDKIKANRKALGLTQTEFGEKLGVKKNAVSKWECGRVDDIPSSKIKIMAMLFGVPTSYLIDDEKEPTPVSESGPISPAQKALLDAVKDMDDDTAKTVLQVVMSVKKLRGE